MDIVIYVYIWVLANGVIYIWLIVMIAYPSLNICLMKAIGCMVLQPNGGIDYWLVLWLACGLLGLGDWLMGSIYS